MKYLGMLLVVILLISCGETRNKDYSVADSTMVKDNVRVADEKILPVNDDEKPPVVDTLDAVKVVDTELPPPIVDTLKAVKVVEEPIDNNKKK